MTATQITKDEYAEWYAPYLATLNDEDLVEELEISLHRFIRYVQDIPMDKFEYRYAEGKWTIKDIVQHLIDSERIFSYRALRFARNDATELPSFDENDYAVAADAMHRNLKDLLTELSLVRHSTIALYNSFSRESLLNKGIAAGSVMSVRALGFVIIGHQNHHQQIFTERYLDSI